MAKSRLRDLIEPLKASRENGGKDLPNVVIHNIDGFARKLADVGVEKESIFKLLFHFVLLVWLADVVIVMRNQTMSSCFCLAEST